MISKQDEKVVYMVGPNVTISTSATSSSSVDTLGFDYASIEVAMPAATATNSSATFGTLKLMEADVTAVSSAANVAAFLGGTAFTIPVQNNTSAPSVTRLMVDTRPRKRYLFLILQGAASHNNITAKADLLRAEQSPSTDAQRGTNFTSVIG